MPALLCRAHLSLYDSSPWLGEDEVEVQVEVRTVWFVLSSVMNALSDCSASRYLSGVRFLFEEDNKPKKSTTCDLCGNTHLNTRLYMSGAVKRRTPHPFSTSKSG